MSADPPAATRRHVPGPHRAMGVGRSVLPARADRAGAHVDAAVWEGRPVFGLWPEPIDWGRVTEREREVYEIGFMNGYSSREDEVAQANADADRYYRVAFDRQHPQRRRW